MPTRHHKPRITILTNSMITFSLNMYSHFKWRIASRYQNESTKDTLWKLFGEQIYNNIQTNLYGTKICECCKERFTYLQKTGKPKIYCDSCAYEKEVEKYEKYNKKRAKNS